MEGDKLIEMYLKAWREVLDSEGIKKLFETFLTELSADHEKSAPDFAASLIAQKDVIYAKLVDEVMTYSDDTKHGLALREVEVSSEFKEKIYLIFGNEIVSSLCPEDGIKLCSFINKRKYQPKLMNTWFESALDALPAKVAYDDGKKGSGGGFSSGGGVGRGYIGIGSF